MLLLLVCLVATEGHRGRNGSHKSQPRRHPREKVAVNDPTRAQRSLKGKKQAKRSHSRSSQDERDEEEPSEPIAAASEEDDNGDKDDEFDAILDDTSVPVASPGPTQAPSSRHETDSNGNSVGGIDGEVVHGHVETPSPVAPPSLSLGSSSSGDGLAGDSTEMKGQEEIDNMLSSLPMDSPSVAPSFVPSLIAEPPQIASTAPIFDVETSAPFPTKGVDEATNQEFTDDIIPILMIDPNDPSRFVCGTTAFTSLATSSGTSREFLVTFVYEIWLEDPPVELDDTLPIIELAMTRAVADAYLLCTGERRLQQDLVISVASSPEDVISSELGCREVTGCSRIEGGMTLETKGTTGEEEMELACGALQVIQDSITAIATTIPGVGAMRYGGSSLWCGDTADAIEANEKRSGGAQGAGSSDSTFGSGKAVAITVASLFILGTGLLVARRRKNASEDAFTEAPSKDIASLQLTHTKSSSPRMGYFGGGGYDILADIHSIGSAEPELSSGIESMTVSPCPSHHEEAEELQETMGLFKNNSMSLFPAYSMDPLPNRLSWQSSEENSSRSDGDDADNNSSTLMTYATPLQLQEMQSTPPKGGSPPNNFNPAGIEGNDVEDRNVASPVYPRLSSLLGRTSESEGTDDDRSIVQFVDGGVSLLKMSDLKGNREEASAHDDIPSGIV